MGSASLRADLVASAKAVLIGPYQEPVKYSSQCTYSSMEGRSGRSILSSTATRSDFSRTHCKDYYTARCVDMNESFHIFYDSL